MSAHYDPYSDLATTPVQLVAPDDPHTSLWDDELPANGRHGLVIGDPRDGALALIGTRDQLAALAARITNTIGSWDVRTVLDLSTAHLPSTWPATG